MSRPASEPAINVSCPPAADGRLWPVVIGVPFPQGTLRDPSLLGVAGPDGKPRPAAARRLVRWPDGSTRWALVTLAADRPGRHTITIGKTHDAPITLGHAVFAANTTRGIGIDNGIVGIELAHAGPGPISLLRAGKRNFIDDPRRLRLCVDDADTTREASRTLTILEQNSVRARVRVEGAHHRPGGQRKLSYRLDVELVAGWPAVRLDYHFFNLEPGADYLDVKRIGIDLDLQLNRDAATRHFVQSWHGVFYEPRHVRNANRVAIVSSFERFGTRVEDPAMLLDTYEYAKWLAPPLVDTQPWLGVADDTSAVYAGVQDFNCVKPKRIDSEGTRLSFDIWPESEGTLSLQQGRSRRTVLTLALADTPAPEQAWIESTLNAAQWEGRAVVDPAWLSRCGEYEIDRLLPFAKHGRLERFLSRTVVVETPTDMFDLGDTIDAGYRQSYPSLGVERQPRMPEAPPIRRRFSANNGVLFYTSHPDMYEPVWVNNEYDGIFAVATELMRTGHHGLWRTLRWMTRHNIEVDFLHYSDHQWLHRVSPVHSYRHSTSGGYPSHFWTQGLLQYYCMTGDPDVLEVAVGLGDAILRFFHDPERGKFYHKLDRELGWALLALVHLWDITREERFRVEIDRIADMFMKHQAKSDADTPSIGKAGPLLNRELISRFYFMLNMVEALDLYQRITKREDLAEWLLKLLTPMPGAIVQNFREGGSAYSTPAAMAIGYERTGDKAFIDAGLVRLDELIHDDSRWSTAIPEIKPMAVLYREFIRFFGAAHHAGALAKVEYPSLREP